MTPDPSAAVPGLSSSQADTYLSIVAGDENTSAAELETLFADIVAQVANQLGGAEAELLALFDAITGQADNSLQAAVSSLGKWITRLTGNTDRTLADAVGNLATVGIQVPWAASDIAAHLGGDWMGLLAAAVPSFNDLVSTPAQPPPADGLSEAWGAIPGADATAPPTTWPTGGIKPGPGELPWVQFLAPDATSPPPPPGPSGYGPSPPPPPAGGGYPPPGTGGVRPTPYMFQQPPAPDVPQTPFFGVPAAPTSPPPPPSYNVQQIPPDKCCPPTTIVTPPANVNVQVVPAVCPPTGPPPPPPEADKLVWPGMTRIVTNEGPLGVNWNDFGQCSKAEAVTGKGLPEVIKDIRAAPPKGISWWMGSYLPWGAGQYLLSETVISKTLSPPVADWINKKIETIPGLLEKTVEKAADMTNALLAGDLISPGGVPNKAAALFYAGRIGLANTAEAKTNMPMSYLFQSDTYIFQYANPQFLPGQIQINAAFLAGTIDSETWVCWTKANGNLPEPARRVMLADQVKPGLLDLITLFRRGGVREADFFKRVREVGVLDPNYAREFLAITKALPTQSDLIRFMVRDASDDAVAEQYGYDEGFTDKFTPTIEKWANALGLDPTYFKYEWRSHWRTPSYTQLSEMLHRLRPDRAEVKEWEAEFGPDVPNPLGADRPPKPLTVTREDVQKAIEVDDMAPAWVPKMIDISYTPINRTDAQRAYMIGAFTETRLYDAYRDVGYNDDDAKTLVAFSKQQKALRDRNVSGVWSIRKVIQYYKGAVLSRADAAALIRPLRPSDQATEEVLAAADIEIAADDRKSMLRAMRRGYMAGEWSGANAARQMLDWGLEPAQARRVVALWEVERDSRYKMPTTGMISQWIRKAIISIEDARVRLKNLGYSEADSDRIVAGALKFDFADDPPTPDELTAALNEAVKSQKDAKLKSNAQLQQLEKMAIATLKRVRSERFKRLPPEARAQWTQLIID